MLEKRHYTYKGPVYSFGQIINDNYYAETEAVSDKKALSNIQYRYKLSKGLMAETKITLNPKYLKSF